MIQRIQTVYLLIVFVLLIVTMCLPMGEFVAADGVTVSVFKPLGISLLDGGYQSTWGLFAIIFLGAVIALCTIFLFRNRMLQVRMTIFNMLLLLGYYLATIVFIVMLKDDLGVFRVNWSLSFPAVSIILNYLAFRAIYRDELMVKAADRLR